MPIRRGFASSVALVPDISISPVTNFNQSLATFNAVVNPNGYTTSVTFQYSTGTTWIDSGTVSNITGDSQSVHFNQSSLLTGTEYRVRAVATNQIGSATTSNAFFNTWSFQVYERTTSGGTTFTIPTVTPTGGSPVAVTIFDIIMFGGGGGGYAGGGGGGASVSLESRSVTGSRSITTSVGAGGSNFNLFVDPDTNAVAGGNTTVSGDITTITATGGNAATLDPGSSGNGNGGGGSAIFDYTPGDKFNTNNFAYGGGGGAGGVGGNGTANSSGTTGGTGGTGVSITRGGVTIAGGAGGGASTSAMFGSGDDGGPHTLGVRGTNNTYGSGGNGYPIDGTVSAQAGYIRFRYYAASALA
jgi:hypothetical protein